MLLHDWGCLFGYQFANLHPQRVARVIAMDVGDTTSKAFLSSLSVGAKLFLVVYQLFLLVAYLLRVIRPVGNGDLAPVIENRN